MIVKAKKGAILSATFERQGRTIDAEVSAFTEELKKLKAKYPLFVVAETVKGNTLEVDVFPASDKSKPASQDDIPTKKMSTMTAEQAAATVAKAVTSVKPNKPAGLAPPKKKKR